VKGFFRSILRFIVVTTGAAAGGTGVLLWRGAMAPGPAADDLPPRRLEATILLPTVDNNNRPMDAQWQAALELLTKEFGGATLGPAQEGCWRDGQGKLRREPVRPVIVSFERGKLGRFREVLDEVGKKLGQEAVYARFEEPRVELRKPGERGASAP
jgi:hypothetical protein